MRAERAARTLRIEMVRPALLLVVAVAAGSCVVPSVPAVAPVRPPLKVAPVVVATAKPLPTPVPTPPPDVVLLRGPAPRQRGRLVDLLLRSSVAPAALDVEVDGARASPWMRWTAATNELEIRAGPLPNGTHTVTVAGRTSTVEAETVIDRQAPVVRGLYVTAYVASDPERRKELFARAAQVGLNAVVVDVKDASGHVFLDVPEPTAKRIGALEPFFTPSQLVGDAHAAHLYLIARIVCFEDPILAAAEPKTAFHIGDKLFLGESGLAWVDPRVPATRDYLVGLARAVAAAGVDEIQLDYVRFPTGPGMDQLDRSTVSGRVGAIGLFLDDVRKAIDPTGVYLSADVFGLTTTAVDDLQIGQEITDIARRVDVVSPMMYPSHYALGSYGLPDPDAAPAATVTDSLTDGLPRIAGSGALMRPWLQAFTLRHPYGVPQVEAQIDAAAALGVHGYLLWDPSVQYDALPPRL